jgi:hypothetical protein
MRKSLCFAMNELNDYYRPECVSTIIIEAKLRKAASTAAIAVDCI